MVALKSDVEAVFQRLIVDAPTTKDDVRRVMAARRLEMLRQNRSTLLAVEARALALLRRVDYRRPLRPRLVFVAPGDRPIWIYYRHILHSAPFTARPFRGLFLFCIDETTGGVLGILDVCSDLNTLGPRERFVGWTSAEKYRRLGCSLNVGTCVSVAPFGLLTGGKFMIEAVATAFVGDTWGRRYGDPAALIVTTSLYGRSSIYNRLPSFRYLGDTPGGGVFHLSAEDWSTIKGFLVANGIAPRSSGAISGRLSSLQQAASAIGLDLSTVGSHQPRGVYAAIPDERALAFLRGDRPDLPKGFTRTQEEVSRWWLDRWYAMRLPKVAPTFRTWDVDEFRVDRQIQSCERSAAIGTALPSAGGGVIPPVRSTLPAAAGV